jgi:hypothetical protein
MKVRAKEDNYQGENRVNCNVTTVGPISYSDEIKRLEGIIAKYKKFGYVASDTVIGSA